MDIGKNTPVTIRIMFEKDESIYNQRRDSMMEARMSKTRGPIE